MTVQEIHDALAELIEAGHAESNIDIFEMRTSCTMPIIGVEAMADDDAAIIVDMAES